MLEGDRQNLNNSSPLRKFLETHIVLPAEVRNRLYCQVVTDSYLEADWKSESIGPRRGHGEFLLARHGVFIFMAGAGASSGAVTAALGVARLSPCSSPTRKKNDHVLVLGMTAWEYALNGSESPSRAYIQYVDTTGLFRPRKLQRSLTRAVVCGYLRYCRQIIKVNYVHLFASAQPSLLFSGSELFPRKRVLESAKLINWWLALIHSSFALPETLPAWQRDHSMPLQGFVYFPGEESFPLLTQSLKANLYTLNRLGGLQWHYNHPFQASSPAATSIPFFEDDPKWRHYEAAVPVGDAEERPTKRLRRQVEAPISVEEFFKSMACRIEFGRDPSAFIILQFPENHTKAISAGSVYYKGGILRRTELAMFASKLLRTMRFDGEGVATKSSMCLWSWLKLRGSTPFELKTEGARDDEVAVDGGVDLDGRMDHDGGLDPLDRGFSQVMSSLQSHSPQPANDVQTLIRRKPFPR